MENQSLVPTGNPEQDLVTPTRSSVATSRTPQSSETISALVRSSPVNRGHRPSQFVTTGHDLPQDDGSVGEIEPLPRPTASAGPSSSARVKTNRSVEHSLRVEPGSTPSLHNPQPCRDGDASCVGASLSANHVDMELLEIELKMKELQLQQQRIELEKRRAHLQTQGGNKEMFGEISDSAVSRRVRKLNEWTAETDSIGGSPTGLVGRTPATLSTLPPYTRQGPLHSTSRFAATVPPGNVTSNRYNTGSLTTPTLNQSQLYARQGNLRDLPPFSGRPEEWATFVSNLERTTAMYGYTDEENIERLSKALRGKAREMVGLRLTSNDLPQVMNVLRRHFGRPEIIVHCLIRKIRQLPVPKLERIESIIDFGNAVQEMAAVISASGLYEYSYNVALLQEIVEKLPPVLRRDWSHHRLRLGVPTITDFSDWMENELEAASYNSMPSFDDPKTETARAEDQKRKSKPTSYLHTMVNANASTSHGAGNCVVCKRTCVCLADCPRFAAMDVNERWTTVKDNKLCRKCLRSHFVSCNEKRLCGENGCVMSHHNLLHQSKPSYKAAPAAADRKTESLNHHTSANDGVLFQYIPVVIHGNERSVETVAFFDSGSSGTFIEEELVAELGLDGKPHPLCIRWTGETQREEKKSVQVQLRISSVENKERLFTLPKVHSVQKLSLPHQSFSAEQMRENHEHLKNLPLTSYTNASPRVLIGIDNCHLVRPLRYAEGKEQEPVAVKTQLGWVVFGPYAENFTPSQIRRSYHICVCATDDTQSMDTAMRNFFSLESLGVSNVSVNMLSKDDERALQMLTTSTKLIGDRYETCLLWRFDDVRLPCSRDMALKRYDCLRKRMRNNPVIANAVLEKMQSYETQGYIRRLTQAELTVKGERDWYLPIFPVYNPNKPGKVRMVFDAAAKSGGVSLNTFLLSGPDLLAGLLTVLYKFREYRVAIVGDIRKCFFK